MKKITLPNFSNSNWFITLVSTTIGVFLGFYLNNYSINRKLQEDKENAFASVTEELKENKNLLTEYDTILKSKYDVIDYLFTKIDDDFKIIIPEDSVSSFKEKTKSVFIFEKYDKKENGLVEVRGNLNLEINSKLVISNLSHIVWDSYKQTNYLSLTDFNCISELESMHVLTEQFNVKNRKWTRVLFEGKLLQTKDSRDAFMYEWKNLIQEEQLLLDYYGYIDTILLECN